MGLLYISLVVYVQKKRIKRWGGAVCAVVEIFQTPLLLLRKEASLFIHFLFHKFPTSPFARTGVV